MTAIISAVSGFLLVAAVSTEQTPRLSAERVGRLADAQVKEARYFPEAFKRSSPVYVKKSRAWLLDYDPKQKQDLSSRPFTVNVDDVSELASILFDPPRTARTERHSRLFEIFNMVYGVGAGIGVAIAFVCWLCGRPVRRFR